MLKKSYPLEETGKGQFKMAVVLAAVLFAFLFILRPFGPALTPWQVFINCAVAGVITFLIIIVNYKICFAIAPHYFKEEKWTIGREIVWTLILLLFISITNIIIAHFFGGNKFSLKTAAEIIFYTTTFGIAPATAAIIINQNRLLNKYKAGAAVINETITAKEEVAEDKPAIEPPAQLVIIAENEKDNLVINAADFAAAIAADNYVKIFYSGNGTMHIKIIRATLKKVEDNAAAFTALWRCHRTAIVNLDCVEKINGNAQGYKLAVKNLPVEIPVSRSLNTVLKEKLSSRL